MGGDCRLLRGPQRRQDSRIMWRKVVQDEQAFCSRPGHCARPVGIGGFARPTADHHPADPVGLARQSGPLDPAGRPPFVSVAVWLRPAPSREWLDSNLKVVGAPHPPVDSQLGEGGLLPLHFGQGRAGEIIEVILGNVAFAGRIPRGLHRDRPPGGGAPSGPVSPRGRGLGTVYTPGRH